MKTEKDIIHSNSDFYLISLLKINDIKMQLNKVINFKG